jgi:hypothetical protein
MFLNIIVNRITKSKVVHICKECKSPIKIGTSYFRVSNFAGVKRYGRNGGTIPTEMVLCTECHPIFDRMITRLGSWKQWR